LESVDKVEELRGDLLNAVLELEKKIAGVAIQMIDAQAIEGKLRVNSNQC